MRHAAETVAVGGAPGSARALVAASPIQPAARVQAEAQTFGFLFRDLRRALRLSLAELSARLQTPIDVIAALEASDVRRLPPWPETQRVVTAYTGLAAIDAAPILGVIRRAIDTIPVETLPEPAAAPRQATRALVTRPRVAEPQPVSARKAGRLDFFSRLVGPIAHVSARLGSIPAAARRTGAIAMILVLLAAVSGNASSLNASFATLHPPIKRLVRSAQDYLLWRAAPVHDGMRWIQVDDPRTRKGDRMKARRS